MAAPQVHRARAEPMEVVIEDANGVTSVFLSDDGDHIAVRYLTDTSGYEREITLAPNTIPWDRAIQRAQRGVVFL